MNRLVLVLTLLLIVSACVSRVYAQPAWARRGVYVEYFKHVEASKTDLAKSYPILDELFDGYVEEKARYILISFDESYFTLSLQVVGATYTTGTKALLEILRWIDKGEKNTIQGVQTLELVFSWYKYSGKIDVKLPPGSIIPSPVNLYIYKPPSTGSNTVKVNHQFMIKLNSTNELLEDVMVTVSINAEYDKTTGFLEKLEAIIKYSFTGLPIVTIYYDVSKTGSNIPEIAGTPVNIDTILAVTAGSVVAAVFAFIVYYYRVKKVIG